MNDVEFNPSGTERLSAAIGSLERTNNDRSYDLGTLDSHHWLVVVHGYDELECEARDLSGEYRALQEQGLDVISRCRAGGISFINVILC